MWVAFAVQKLLTFFQQKILEYLYIESAKTVNEMTLKELVKLTTLWTSGPWILHLSGALSMNLAWSPVTIWLICLFQHWLIWQERLSQRKAAILNQFKATRHNNIVILRKCFRGWMEYWTTRRQKKQEKGIFMNKCISFIIWGPVILFVNIIGDEVFWNGWTTQRQKKQEKCTSKEEGLQRKWYYLVQSGIFWRLISSKKGI